MCVCVCAAGDVKVMDGLSNGLDAATTFDIIRALKTFVTTLHCTTVLSLLQPSPEVFQLFDDLLLLSHKVPFCDSDLNWAVFGNS